MRLPRLLALVLSMAVTAACGGQAGDPQDLPEGELGTTEQPLTCSAASADSCILTTYDGYAIFRSSCSDNGSFYTTDTKADACCTAGTSGCKYTGLRWQCVEWARRYMWKQWGPVWPGVTGAKDMCASHPSGTKLVSKPLPGDVVVYGAAACLQKNSAGTCIVKADATYGHVGVVEGNPSSTKDWVKDQNGPQNAHNDYLKSAAKCYVHATSNPRCWAGAKQTVTDSACASGSATQTCTSSNAWGAKTCVPVTGSDAGVAGAGGSSGAGGSAGASGGSAGVSGSAGASGGAGASGASASSGGASGASGATGWVGGTGGSTDTTAGDPDAGTSSPKTRMVPNQDSGCSVDPGNDEPPGAPLVLIGLALGLARIRFARRARAKR